MSASIAAATAQAQIDLARAARRAGDRRAAVRHLEAALALTPDRRDLRIEMGYDLVELGRADDAQRLFQALEAETPGEPDVLIGLGRTARRRGDHAAALPLFQAAVAKAPKNLGGRLDVAYALLDLGQAADADQHFVEVLADHPSQVNALLGRARVARRAGDRAAAVGIGAAAVQVDPEHHVARIELATDLVELGQLDEAESHARAALERAPRNVDTLLLVGRIARRLGRRAEAADLFSRALGVNPTHLGARLDLGFEEVERGEPDAAESLFRAVLADHPNQANAMVGLARIARKRGDRAEVRAQLEAAIAADPSNTSARLELAADLREWGEIEAARPLIEAAARINPEALDTLLHKGALQRQAGEHEAALATFAIAAEHHPRAAQPFVEAALESNALGRPADAAAWLERALAVAPGQPEAMALQADLAWVAEDHARCRAICEQARALHPHQAWPYITGARALSALGDWLDGMALLDKAEAALGPRPEITAGRIEVLKPRGAWPQVRAVLAGAADDVATNFRLFVEQVQCHIAYGEFAAATALLAASPATSARDLARVAMLRGYIAEAQWQLDEAVAQYRDAVAQSPQDAGMHNELARACLLRLDLEGAGEHNAISVRLNTTAARLRRESLSPAQTHLGQVLDEFRMDHDATEELARLGAVPAAERIVPLCGLMRQNPGHTPTAICLTLALRQAGMLSPARPVPQGHAVIPRRIMQFWDAPEPAADLLALMATWRENNPGWTYERFDAASAHAFLAEHFGREAQLAFRRARHPAHKADLFRLAWLHVHGGLYVDADDRCLAPLEGVLPPGTSFVGYQEGFSTVSNNVLGAVPGHPVIARALAGAIAALNRGDSDSLWLSTGPGLITRSFAAEFAESPLRPEIWLRGVRVLERFELLRSIAVHCFARYKTTRSNWKRAEFAAPDERMTATAGADTQGA